MKQKHWQVSVFDKTSETIKNDTFYTTDTEAYLVFELIDDDFTPDFASITVYNVNGKATIHVNVDVVDRIVRYEIPQEAIEHLGVWRTQVIFTKNGEDYTTNIIEFEVSGHLLDKKKPKVVIITNWNHFIKHAGGLVDAWEHLEEIRQANEQQRELAESKRKSNESVRVANEAERVSKDSERNSKIENLEEQFQDVLDETTGKDIISAPEVILARGGYDNLSQRLFSTDQQLQQTEQELAAQLAHKAEQDALNAEKARIDTLIALPDGSTTNDARLEDITAGADGIIYDSPGNAVRGQYSRVNSRIERFKDSLRYIGLTETDAVFAVTESAYAGSIGYIDSSTHDSYEVTLQNETTLYFDDYDSQYTSLCVFTSGTVGGDGYTRYRTLTGGENTLPTVDTKVTLPAGTVIIISVSKANGNFKLMQNGEITKFYLSNDVILNSEQLNQLAINSVSYVLTYQNGVLEVKGQGLDCYFSTKTFTDQDGLFELQNLIYNTNVIFTESNDYIGPVRVNGEPIKGGKHDGEVTDSVIITTEKGALTDGQTVEASKFTVFVKSHISDEFSRVSSYAFDGNTMTTHSIITTLKDLQIDYVFGAGIISCQDDVNIAWLNKDELTTDVLIGLNEQTSIVCQNGTLISKRLSVNSNFGDKRVAFNVYTGRKKLYYYTCYGNNIAVPSGSVFASSNELTFS